MSYSLNSSEGGCTGHYRVTNWDITSLEYSSHGSPTLNPKPIPALDALGQDLERAKSLAAMTSAQACELLRCRV